MDNACDFISKNMTAEWMIALQEMKDLISRIELHRSDVVMNEYIDEVYLSGIILFSVLSPVSLLNTRSTP